MIDIITYGIIILVGIIIAYLVARPLKFLQKPFFNLIISTIVLFLTNSIGLHFNFHIGINLITVAFVALLGIPGYTTLLIFALLF